MRFELRDDLPVGAAHMSRDTPDIDTAEETVCAHAHDRLGCPCGFPPPVATAAEDDQSIDHDVDPFRNVDIDIACEPVDVDCQPRRIEFRFTQVEVDIGQDADYERAPAQPKAAASHEMTERRDAQLHSRPSYRRARVLWQTLPRLRKLRTDLSSVGAPDPLREAVECQPSGQEVVAQGRDCLFPLGV